MPRNRENDNKLDHWENVLFILTKLGDINFFGLNWGAKIIKKYLNHVYHAYDIGNVYDVNVLNLVYKRLRVL